MELTQKLGDIKKEAASNEEALQHWQTEHDKLKLHDLECVTIYLCVPLTDIEM